MDYLPASRPALPHTATDTDTETDADTDWRERERQRLADPAQAVISLYARGRDYHKVLRQRLQQLADFLASTLAASGLPQALQARVFTDSAPVLEVELASRSGLGWRGKHTLTLSREAGSMFFLGEIFVNLALPLTPAVSAHCGGCEACIRACPTGAILGPYRLDARRCISYLTIEHAGPIAPELRPLLGNRIYGCDDCQLACPWNKFAQTNALPDFAPRPALGDADLLSLWAWDEATFLRRTEGSAIRRIGFERWQRNLAVAMGNALAAGVANGVAHSAAEGAADGAVDGAASGRSSGAANLAHQLRQALQQRLPLATPLVAEHIAWALAQA